MARLIDNLEELQSIAKERTVKTQTIEYDLETMVKKVDRNVIKLNPEYQRKHRWSVEASSRLIESLILNIPIPFIYISQDVDVDEELEDGVARYSVIDGQQRLTAIHGFFKNKYALTELDVLESLNGCTYSQLPPFLIRRLEERSIKCLRIDSTVDQQVKYDIFERLNSGSVKLEPQELRNATCRGPFKELIKKLSKNEHFTRLANLEPDGKRVQKMEDEELVLRYFALTYKDAYMEYKGGFKKFLTDKMSKLNQLKLKEIKDLEVEFSDVMKLIASHNHENPFAKYKLDDSGELKRMSKFNAAVFDAIVALYRTLYLSGKTINPEKIVELFKKPNFFEACQGSVNDVSKTQLRINLAKELV
ncbi:DUF262 domain-containing protein [Psychrosphaera aestuarii]|uniref:DUF262 domain-containing protein n=1 Tax=Psychrosphaera aestuarii TaxID=1266052 RepID=UPI001B3354E5|nr:DUF262 domain-containing protein [Psychrosphaera aestuarii]